MLLGLRNSKLHGKDVGEWGNLRLLRSRFGCGWAIRGTHELLQFPAKCAPPSYSMELHAVRNSSEEVPEGSQVFHVVTSHGKAAEFHELAELGTTPNLPASVAPAAPTVPSEEKDSAEKTRRWLAGSRLPCRWTS